MLRRGIFHDKQITVKSIIVMANPKAIIKKTYASKEIQDQIIRAEKATKVIDNLIEINNILEKYEQHFAYRVRAEIVFYVIYAVKNDLFYFNQAMDYSIVQKILPKIGGSGGEVLDNQ